VASLDGQKIVERLEAIDDKKRSFRYTNIAGIPVSQYSGELEVQVKGKGCIVEWRAQFLANHRSDTATKAMVSRLLNTGLAVWGPASGSRSDLTTATYQGVICSTLEVSSNSSHD
jgi:hypothetical protein